MTIVLEATKSGQSVIRMLSGCTDVFVLLVHLVNRADIQCKLHMERCNESVLDIKATSADFGHTRYAYHTISGCDTFPYPYGKGKVTALKTTKVYL